MKDRILVTGGSGFLGSALVRRLVKEGHKIVVMDDNSRGSFDRLNDIRDQLVLCDVDIRDKDNVVKFTRGCKSVFHLAFVNGTKFFYEKPDLVLDVGVKGALNTIQAAKECGVENYILASSSEVYQQPTHIPTSELERCIIPDILNPRFSYAGGKLISELLAINFFRATKVRDLIFRPHNVFGPDMGIEHVVPELIFKLYNATDGWSKTRVDLEIQGSGDETRAFCYVEDAVDQIMYIYNSGFKGELYHVGVDNEITIKQLVKLLAKVLEINVNIIPGEARLGGTSKRCPDISKIMKLGYRRNDRFMFGLKNTVQWYKHYFGKRNF